MEGTESAVPPAPPPVVEPTQVIEPQPLQGIPLPPAVLLLAVLTLAAFVAGLVRAGPSFKLAIDYERGQRELTVGQPMRAVVHLVPVARAYPKNKEVRIALATAFLDANDPRGAVRVLRTFEGQDVSDEESAKLDALVGRIERLAPPEKPDAATHKAGKQNKGARVPATQNQGAPLPE